MSRLFAPLAVAVGLALAAPAAPAAQAAPPAHRLLHVVQSGDTLSAIAHRYGCPLEDLLRRNHLRSDHIVVGSKLSVPWPDPRLRVAPEIHVSHHRVLPGETLLSIADRYDADARSIRLYNAISGDRIRVGQRLEIPTAGPALVRHAFGYEVQPGDTVVAIARRLDVPVRHIRYLNPDADLRNLEAGQLLTVYRYEPMSDETSTLSAEAGDALGAGGAAAAATEEVNGEVDGDVNGDVDVDIDIDDFDDAEEPATPAAQAQGAIKAAGEAVARATGTNPGAPAAARPVAKSKAKVKASAAPTLKGKATSKRLDVKRALRPEPAPQGGACRCTCPPPAPKPKRDSDDDFAYERGE